MTNNRNPIKNMFITFPKSTMDKKEFSKLLIPKHPSYMKCVEEKHKDGSPHLHLIVQYVSKYSKAHIIKYLKEHLPNDWKRIKVESLRSIKHCEVYLNKEDKKPYLYGEYVEGRKGHKKSPAQIFLQKVHNYYGTVESFLEKEKLPQEYEDKIPQIVDTIRWYSNWDSFSMSFEAKQKFEKLFRYPHSIILKDDITFLCKYLNIK